jgi:Flp pilus assembly protein protease CpaA
MHLLQGIMSIAILNGCFIIIYDWRYKAVPLYLLLLFGCLSVIYGVMMHDDWQTVAILAGGSFVALLYLVYKKMLGLADCLLIPCCFAWIDIEEIPLFLVLCGVFGIATSLFWCKYYTEKEYPFTPAILFSLSLLLVS